MQKELKKLISASTEPSDKMLILCIRSRKINLNGIWTWPMQSSAVYCSDVMSFPDEFEGTKAIIHPDDLPKLMTAIAPMGEKEIALLSFRIITTYGEVKTVSGQNVFINNQKQILPEPIAEKNLWQEALEQIAREKELDFLSLCKTLADFSEQLHGIGCWLLNKTLPQAWYSDNVFRLYGLAPQSINAHFNSFTSFIHHDDRQAVLNAFEKAYGEELPLHIEYRIVLANGDLKYIQQITKWIYSSKGEQLCSGIIRDVTEERRAINEILSVQSDTLLHQQVLKLVEQETATAYWYIHLATKQASYSQAYYRIYGFKQANLPVNNFFLHLVHADDRKKMEEAYERMYRDQIFPEMEFRIIRTDGRLRYLKQTGKVFTNANREKIMIVVVQDNTVQRGFEQKIHELNEAVAQNKLLSELIETTAGLSSITWLPNGSMKWSDGFYRMLGPKAGTEPSSKRLYESIHPDDIKTFRRIEAAIQKEEETEPAPIKFITRNGIKQTVVSFRKLQLGKEIIVAVLQDAGQSMEWQQQSFQNKLFAETVADTVKEMIIFTNSDHIIIHWNAKAEQKTDIAKEQALFQNLFDVLPQLKKEDFLEQLKEVASGKEINAIRSESGYLKKPHDYWLHPLKNESGELLGMLHVVQDVSKQVEMQQQLNERLGFIETLLEASVDRIVALDRNMNYLYWNKKAEEYYGTPKEIVIGKNILEIFPSFRNDPGYNEFRKVLKGETVHLPAAVYEESSEYAETYLTPIKDETGEVTAVLWIVHDLSKEFLLQQEQRKTYGILDAIETACYELDREGNIIYLNRKAEEFLGKSKEEMMGKNIWDIFPESKESKCWPAIQLSALDKKQSAQFEYVSSVSKTWISLNATPTEEGCIVLFNEIQDIIEARTELERQQETVRQMLNSSMAAIVFLQSVRDEEGKIIDFIYKGVNKSAERATGYTAEQLLNHSYLLLFPKAKDVFFDAYAEVVETGKMLHTEKHYPYEQFGKDTWFEVTAVKNGDGLILTFLDITERKKTEWEILRLKDEVAQKATDKYLALFNTMEEGFLLVELIRNEKGRCINYKHLEANPAFEKLVGPKPEEIIGKTVLDVFPLLDDWWFQAFEEVANKKHARRFEHYLKENGSWYEVLAYPMWDDQVAILYNNITQRKRRELNTALLDQISKDLAMLSTPEEIMQTVGRRTGEFLQLSGCMFVDVEEEKEQVTVHYAWNIGNVPGMKQTFEFKDYVTEEFSRACHAGENFVVTDTANDLRIDAAAYAQLKIGAFITIPFFRQGQWTAYTAITTVEPHNWRQDEIELLTEISNRLFFRIERARAEQALRESEENFRTLFTTMEQGFCIVEKLDTPKGQPSDYRYIIANPAFEGHTQMKDVVGKTILQLVPDAETIIMDAYDEVVAKGEYRHLEGYVSALGLWMEADVIPTQKPGQIAVLFTNITERKKAEETLKESEERKTFLLKLSDAFHSLSDPVAIQETVTHVAMDHFRADRCYYCEIEGDQSIIRRDAAIEGLPSVAGVYALNDIPIFKAIVDAGKPFVVDDVRTTKVVDESLRQLCIQLQVISFIDVPIIKNKMPVGILCIVQSIPRHWTKFEVQLAEEVAERTWLAVERAKVQEAFRKSEEQLKNFNATLEQQINERTTELQKNLTLLRYTEYLAQSGTWDYEVATGNFKWSEGMYRLFGLSQQRKVTPEIYLRHAIEQDRPIAKKIVTLLQTKQDPFEEILRIKRNGDVRTIKVKGSVITDENGKAQRIIGVDVDITNIQKAEDQLKESRHWLEQTAKASPDSITIYDVEKKQPTYLNNCLAEWLGMSGNDLLEMGFEERLKLIYPDDQTELLQNNEKAATAKDNDTINMEYRLKTNYGKTIWVRNRSKPFQRDDLGKVTHILSILQNVTEEVQLREELKQRTQYAESIIDASIDRIAVYDKELRVIAWNRRAEEVTGRKRQNVLGKKLFDVFPKVGQDEELLKAHLDALEGSYVSLPAKRGIYTNNYYERFFIPLKNERKETYAIVCIMHDVSELVNRNAELNELNQSLEQKNEELEQKNEEITSFAFVASHDMKEPLRKIHTFSDWLMEQEAEQLSEKGKSMLEKMNTSVHRMEVLIDDILVLTKIHSDTRKEEEVNLNKVLRQVFDNMFEQILLTQTGVHADELPIIKGNSNQIFYLFHNLISNAIKFQKPGNVPQIKITAEIISGEETGFANPYEEYAKISFADNGFGFDQRYAKKIFQVFQRLHGRHEFEGTGIGLAICKKIMENHEGMITVESEQGRGSVFSCYFPLF